MIEVKAAGICGTDIHVFEGEFPASTPCILGHEFSGVIVEKGGSVSGFEIGDRITSETAAIVCGRCRYCLYGNYNLCYSRKGFGYGVVGGAFARYIAVPEVLLHKIPDNLSFEVGAVTEPVAVALHAASDNADIKPNDLVVITGPGPIGLLLLQVAKFSGARVLIIGTSVDLSRLQMATKLGADWILNMENEDPVEKIRDLTDGEGCDVVFEASGNPLAIDQAVKLVRKRGWITLVGLYGKRINLDPNKIVMNEINVRGTWSQNWRNWEAALQLMSSRKIMVEPLITHRFGLYDWEKAFKLVKDKEAIKVILAPG